MDSGDPRFVQLARLIHARACFGATIPELCEMAHQRADLIAAAIMFARDADHDPETPVPPAVVVARLREALRTLA